MENIDKFALTINTTRLKEQQKTKKNENKQTNKKTVGSISYQAFRERSPWIRFYVM